MNYGARSVENQFAQYYRMCHTFASGFGKCRCYRCLGAIAGCRRGRVRAYRDRNSHSLFFLFVFVCHGSFIFCFFFPRVRGESRNVISSGSPLTSGPPQCHRCSASSLSRFEFYTAYRYWAALSLPFFCYLFVLHLCFPRG